MDEDSEVSVDTLDSSMRYQAPLRTVQTQPTPLPQRAELLAVGTLRSLCFLHRDFALKYTRKTFEVPLRRTS